MEEREGGGEGGWRGDKKACANECECLNNNFYTNFEKHVFFQAVEAARKFSINLM